jgi:hypothetical protein
MLPCGAGKELAFKYGGGCWKSPVGTDGIGIVNVNVQRDRARAGRAPAFGWLADWAAGWLQDSGGRRESSTKAFARGSVLDCRRLRPWRAPGIQHEGVSELLGAGLPSIWGRGDAGNPARRRLRAARCWIAVDLGPWRRRESSTKASPSCSVLDCRRCAAVAAPEIQHEGVSELLGAGLPSICGRGGAGNSERLRLRLRLRLRSRSRIRPIH